MHAWEYTRHDGLGLADLVARREVTPGELVDAAIDTIERHNTALNAVVFKAYDEAREAAKKQGRGGPFQGVPFLIKDIARGVAGWPSSWGSRFAGTGPAASDSVIVQRYRQAGLVLLGATNTPEFAIPGVTQSEQLGACRNPWHVDHISGGSSGGACAAVASGMVPAAHATDGLGSIRIPAACCGLVGLKPTLGRTPIDPGARWQARGLIVDHVVSRSVRDSAALLDATGCPQATSPYAPPAKSDAYLSEANRAPGRLRIAWSSQTPNGHAIDAEIQAALEKTADLMAALGHDVRPEGLDIDQPALYRAQRTVSAASFAAEMKAVVARVGREPGETELGALARRLYRRGQAVSGPDTFVALQDLRLLSWQILERFQTFDVYLTPVLGTVTPRLDQIDPLAPDLHAFDLASARTFPFTAPFNITGQPSIALPLWQSASGLPIGMLFTARFADEATLFRLAGQLERELPWAARRPPAWSVDAPTSSSPQPVCGV
jgi:amidase